MSRLRTLFDDTEVTLSFYGSIVYLAEVSSLGSQSIPARPAVAISALVATATVLFIAHAFASVVPQLARASGFGSKGFLAALVHDTPLLATAVVPVLPLALGAWGIISTDTSYRWSVRLTMAMLFLLAVSLGRREGLSWQRALLAGSAIIALTLVVIWLESQLH